MRQKAPTKNQYYIDPLDAWAEKHPVITGLVLGALVFANIFLACLL